MCNSYYFLSNIFKNLVTLLTIYSLSLTANLLPSAFPPIVNAAMILVVKSVTIVSLHPSLLDISIATTKPAEPLTIPHISPIPSLQNDELF